MPIEPDSVSEGATDNDLGSNSRVSRRRRLVILAGAVGIPTLAFVLWWFQPQALFFDDVVDETFPVDAASDQAGENPDDRRPADDAADTPSAPDSAQQGTSEQAQQASTGPVELAAGSFTSRNRYTVTGTATIYQLEDGQRILRLEDFESTNGPDLFVYLTVAGTADDDDALDAQFVDLGVLTGNIGNQNYAIPPDVDLDLYTSVAIWCRRFTTSFGVADLEAAVSGGGD